MKTTTKQHGKWEATLAMMRALKKRVERIEKLLAIRLPKVRK